MITTGFFMKGDRVACGSGGVKGKPALQAGRFTTLDTVCPTSVQEGMKNPEVIMHSAHPRDPFIVQQTALEAAGIALRVARRVPAPLKSLADQVIRSATSVPANLAEGNGRTGRDRMHHWRIAYGSAKEVDVHLQLLLQAGAVDTSSASMALRLFDQVRAMTWRLLHPTG